MYAVRGTAYRTVMVIRSKPQGIAEVQCRPDPHAEQEREDEGVADAEVCSRRRAEVAGQKDSTDVRRTRDCVQDRDGDQEQTDPYAVLRGEAGVDGAVNVGRESYHTSRAVE